MIKIHTTSGNIDQGRQELAEAIRSLKDGNHGVELKRWSGMKTHEQIKTIHGPIVEAYSDYTGLTRKEAKRELKLDHGFNEYFEKNGERYVEIKSLSDYTKDEMRHLIEGILHHLEHDCGIILDFETRKKLHIDTTTGELTELQNHTV